MKVTVLPVVFVSEEPLSTDFFKTFAEHLGDAIEDFTVLHQMPCGMAIAIRKPVNAETMQ